MSVLIERRDGIATVTLNRPEKLNALNEDMYAKLTEGFDALALDDTVRAVIVTGAGRGFCSGSDIGGMLQSDLISGRARLQRRHRTIRSLVNIEKPVIAAVRGSVAGIGFSLALACDLIVAAESTKFSQIFKKVGLVPDGGAVYFLTQRLGIARAKELVYTARPLLAQEALEWGVASRVVPDDQLDAEARALATEFAASATYALAMAKRMFQSMYVPTLEALLEMENLSQGLARLTDDHREGVTAFREKRNAVFKGH